MTEPVFRLSLITAREAEIFAGWRYGPGYGLYDMADEDAVRMMLPRLRYHAVRRDGGLVGFACFGEDAKVVGGPYRLPALDFGCGMDPKLCGQGLGAGFITAIATFASQVFQPPLLRLSVAWANLRAIKTYERSGFTVGQRFAGMTHGGTHTFLIMTRAPFAAPPD